MKNKLLFALISIFSIKLCSGVCELDKEKCECNFLNNVNWMYCINRSNQIQILNFDLLKNDNLTVKSTLSIIIQNKVYDRLYF